MKRKRAYIISGAIIVFLSIIYFSFSKKTDDGVITCKVAKGIIEVKVQTTGQLEAEKSEDIKAPSGLSSRNVGIYEIKITDLIEEGSIVDSGQFVANLDHKVLEELITKALEEVRLATVAVQDAKMDSSLTLSNIRDQLINSASDVEERKIVVNESAFESPSVIRKAEMDLEKVKRKFEQDKKGFKLKERQAKAKVDRVVMELDQKNKKVEELTKLTDELTIKAPKHGMVIYSKDRVGNKVQIGSSVATYFGASIATLPDMTKMISKTYVNEIDISKIKKGQKVTLSIDAFPEKVLNGEVFTVANMGQPMPKSDAKVFEVKIRVFGFDPQIKPAMTTSNTILTGVFKNQLFIPTEAVYANDSVKYVYLRKKGIVRQIVDLGGENENYIIVNKGLSEGDELVFNEPEKPEDVKTQGWEIYKEQKTKLENEKKTSVNPIKKEPEVSEAANGTVEVKASLPNNR
jgi:HlyD family secretion protein